ncbi:FitA-like ribbon-helix-helix domain-containing protein [Brachybacterium squillarum]|uniref:FitA-like ribbon-helix-helix domain-containing protein n=1 Tax=Brachybacterium squillarum TaxID=661979 RepID=UPI002223E4E4|nr:hypothetical protein [Brachybacterium squillarum]MCW1804066.1 hypothetical protein [Brachybacterium squillarum]
MEQILIRNLPVGTRVALRARAQEHGRSSEAEAREILAGSLADRPATLVDLLRMDDGVEFEPSRLGLTGRDPEL